MDFLLRLKANWAIVMILATLVTTISGGTWQVCSEVNSMKNSVSSVDSKIDSLSTEISQKISAAKMEAERANDGVVARLNADEQRQIVLENRMAVTEQRSLQDVTALSALSQNVKDMGQKVDDLYRLNMDRGFGHR